jgi:hypothetical protein
MGCGIVILEAGRVLEIHAHDLSVSIQELVPNFEKEFERDARFLRRDHDLVKVLPLAYGKLGRQVIRLFEFFIHMENQGPKGVAEGVFPGFLFSRILMKRRHAVGHDFDGIHESFTPCRPSRVTVQ